MNNKTKIQSRAAIAAAAFFVSLMFIGSIYTSKNAYAHNFSSDESASYLAKVQEVPVEAQLVQSDVSANNMTLVKYHSDKLTQYWTTYDTGQMAERNALLAKEIPDTIANITAQISMPNPDASKISQLVSNLDSYMSESVSVRIDPPKLQNLTVSALAIKTVLDEVLNDYGNATGATMSLTDMNNMGKMSMSNGSMAGMSGSTAITNYAAYQSAQNMTNAVEKMWTDLKSSTPSTASSNAITALDGAFAKLKQVIDGKQSADQLMQVVHGTIHPNLMTAYNLQMAGMSSMSGGMNMTGSSGSSSGLSQKRLAYLSETALQRHKEHLAMKMPTTGGYEANSSYTLTSSGNDKMSLDLSVYKSTNSIVAMDVMGGSVTPSGQAAVAVQSGHAYYLPGLNKFIVIGYAGQKDSMGMMSGVQVLKIWAGANGKLPTSSSGTPLIVSIIGSASGIDGMQLSSQNATVAASSGASMPGGNTTGGAPSSASVSIVPGAQNLADKAFNPNPISVSKGSSVTWTNNDNAAHTVTSGDGTTGKADGTFDSGILSAGKTFSFTFANSGTYKYFCQLHPTMMGTVNVQ